MTKRANEIGLVESTRLRSYLRIPLYRNAYALIFSSVTSAALGIAYWLLAARLYPTDFLGRNSTVIAALMFLSGVSTLYLDGALIRFLPRAGQATKRLVGYAYLSTASVAVLVGLCFLAGLTIWSPELAFLRLDTWVAVSFCIATVTSALFGLEDGVLTGLRQAVWVPLENITYGVIKIVLLIFLASAFPQYGILASWTISMIVLLVPVNLLIFGRLIPQHQRAAEDQTSSITSRQITQYVLANYIGFLFMLAYTRLLPVLVIHRLGSMASAYFFLPWIITSSLQLVTINMSMSMTVEASLDQRKLAIYARHAIIHTAHLLVPVVIILVIGASAILRLFGDSYAAEGTWVLRLLALATLPNIICVLYFGLARVQQRIGRIVFVQAVLAMLVLGLSYVLIGPYGITGVGLACLASQSIVALVLLLTQLRPILRLEQA